MTKQERIFSISGNNKGLMCPFKAIVCQEGCCKACQIYLDWQRKGGSLGEKSGMKIAGCQE